ncbi:hypothetical protein ACFDTO_38685 [Microbacteriaceae bacterium 4G12]
MKKKQKRTGKHRTKQEPIVQKLLRIVLVLFLVGFFVGAFFFSTTYFFKGLALFGIFLSIITLIWNGNQVLYRVLFALSGLMGIVWITLPPINEIHMSWEDIVSFTPFLLLIWAFYIRRKKLSPKQKKKTSSTPKSKKRTGKTELLPTEVKSKKRSDSLITKNRN